MDDLFNELKLLENNLDNLDVFKQLYLIAEKIKNNQELINLIKSYNCKQNDELRKKIYSYEEIKEYKKRENEINYLILEINKQLKGINTIRSCNNANN